MPIFVDYAGMNTLLNQSIDTTANELNKGEERLRTIPLQTRAIATDRQNNAVYKFMYVDEHLNGLFPERSSSPRGEGFAISLSVRFHSPVDINSMKMLVVGADSLEASQSSFSL